MSKLLPIIYCCYCCSDSIQDAFSKMLIQICQDICIYQKSEMECEFGMLKILERLVQTTSPAATETNLIERYAAICSSDRGQGQKSLQTFWVLFLFSLKFGSTGSKKCPSHRKKIFFFQWYLHRQVAIKSLRNLCTLIKEALFYQILNKEAQ